jgi:S-adenosylmethionine:tRNA ribosyltransferase-isomerase
MDYLLPEELIAQTPLEDRAASRLLHLDKVTGRIQHLHFRDCLTLLHPGDLLVLNDTRVTALRLYGRRATGAHVEALLLREDSPGTYEALTKPAKKLKLDEVVDFEDGLLGTIKADLGEGRKLIQFADPQQLDQVGRAPLPPYIRASLADRSRYQTVYAETPGSAAAPTAGLHFTPEILQQLKNKGVETARVTLDVSLDTFRPMTGSLDDHVMHGERASIPEETARQIHQATGRIIAVGTTTTRTLETRALGRREVSPGDFYTRIFIRPGYSFRVIDGMFTNFHMPKTTMLLMISALAGESAIETAYQEAVALRYRFLSFGDSMLIS